MENAVYTIGHSTHTIDHFVGLLKRADVTAVADVRSSPYSRMNPQYNREALAEVLREAGIEYVFLGGELGARTDDPACYRDGKVQYELLAETESFQRGLDRVLRGSQEHRIALMCAEKEPLDCHRTILVSRRLAERGVPVNHILADGSVEPHEQTVSRLLENLGISRDDLFRSEQEAIDDAYRIQGERVAHDSTQGIDSAP